MNPLSANSTKWSNTLKQFVGKLPTKCLSVFDYFVGLAIKGLKMNPFQTNTPIYVSASQDALAFTGKYQKAFR